MSWLRSVAFRLRQMLSKSRAERELAEELQYHIEAQAQENLAKGMNESEARRAALLRDRVFTLCLDQSRPFMDEDQQQSADRRGARSGDSSDGRRDRRRDAWAQPVGAGCDGPATDYGRFAEG